MPKLNLWTWPVGSGGLIWWMRLVPWIIWRIQWQGGVFWLDYWRQVDWCRWPNWTVFRASVPPGAQLWLIESGGPRHYADAYFTPGDYLVVGRETVGLPPQLLRENPQQWLRLPMFNPQSRSLNLSKCVAAVLYEALRQQGFAGELI